MSESAGRKAVVFDTDNTFGVAGRPIDDGQAMLYAFGRDDLDVLGITTTHGNSTTDVVHDATRWLVAHSRYPDIPIYRGAAEPGDYDTEAAHYLADIVQRRPGEIYVVAIGTMSNIYGAARINPDFFGQVREITAMGGYRHELPVRGWNRIGEVNLSRDYRASYEVLHGGAPLTLFDAHICLQVPFGLRELRPWCEFDRRAYYVQLDYLLSNIGELTEPVDYLWDLLPVVSLSYPELFHTQSVVLASSLDDLKTGTMRYESPESAEQQTIAVPDYITDIDRCYEVMYDAWRRSPLLYS